ncbi:hypothetical protein J2799_004391 [Chryseobacterium vietnamense]|uniref:hypothetical protein n=1 Tax=Chryseobacterium vietnamense TaxID=866785 RepID=UPI00285C5459|nr:hypothetical protein [Chryseobacterium vietnamense]MDR6489841.1 hypothetical protein [Chryseobacterium vietnamense]
MIKIIFIVATSFILYSCGVKSKIAEGNSYRIVRIDSIENVYLIYAEKKDVNIKNTDIIKIASVKTKTHCKSNKIVTVANNYSFILTSLYPKNLVSHHLIGITYNEVLIPFDKDYNIKKDLFITNNLNGLCYK